MLFFLGKIKYNVIGDEMDGFFLVNKPAGMTSHDVVKEVKKRFHIEKIGHTGTLDPFATGLLVLCVGQATKLSDMITNDDKSYEGEILFGVHTDTYDITGTVTDQMEATDINQSQIEDQMASFIGSYQQRPPMYSAIKKDGIKAYKAARKGQHIQLDKRLVHIYRFEAKGLYKEQKIAFFSKVSKGTYIRSLVVDLAQRLNTLAVLSQLHRVSIGSLSVSKASDLNTLKPTDLMDLKTYLKTYQSLTLSDYLIHLVKNGVYLDQRQIKTEQPFVVYDQKGHMIAFYEVIESYRYKPVLIFKERLHESHSSNI